MSIFYYFKCPECENIWGSHNDVPSGEWCACSSVDEPELIYEEQGQL